MPLEAIANFLSHTLPPASVPAVVAIALATIVFVSNYRRPINHRWTLMLLLCALWQGFIAIAQWPHLAHKLTFIKLGSFFGGIMVCSCWLLVDTILTPWRSFWNSFQRVRFQLLLIVLYLCIFSDWYIPQESTEQHRIYGPLYWLLNACACFSMFSLLGYCYYNLKLERAIGIAKRELIAFVVLSGFVTASYLSTFLVGSVLSLRVHPWLASLIFVIGLVSFAGILVRGDVFDLCDINKIAILFVPRFLFYISSGILSCFVIVKVGLTTKWQITGTIAILGLLLWVLSSIDRELRAYVDRRLASRDFLLIQTAVNSLTEQVIDGNELHSKYVELFLRWSDGSPEMFLSDAVFAASWPANPIPAKLLLNVAKHGWVTPEIFDRQGMRHADELAFLVENQIAAMVCHTAQSGDKLMAAFKTRASQRPFVSRELREAHELLRAMQIGFSFVKLRQKLRGSDRLNFYSQYAPQFAHELRNGLYLQAQLLRAIADGRTAEVKQSDAKLGLEQVAQVDRLCEHFFNVGSLFNRPVSPLNVREVLAAIVDRATVQYACAAQIEIELNSDVPPALHFCVNRDLFEVAVLNLIKNSVEVLEGTARPGRIEIAVSKHLEKIHLVIQDNGPGLPMDRRQDPFAPGLSRKRKGMGLGLAIVRDCIEAMGGTVGMRSSNDEGTCFEISLACAERLNGSAAPCGFIGVPT